MVVLFVVDVNPASQQIQMSSRTDVHPGTRAGKTQSCVQPRRAFSIDKWGE